MKQHLKNFKNKSKGTRNNYSQLMIKIEYLNEKRSKNTN